MGAHAQICLIRFFHLFQKMILILAMCVTQHEEIMPENSPEAQRISPHA